MLSLRKVLGHELNVEDTRLRALLLLLNRSQHEEGERARALTERTVLT